MDVPELLHPQYLLGSASCCTSAVAQISLEPAKKIVKNQQAINRSYLYLAEIEKWHKSRTWLRLETFVSKKLNNNELVWSKPAVRLIQQRHVPQWPRPLLLHVHDCWRCENVRLDFADRQSTMKTTKIGSLKNFRPYSMLTLSVTKILSYCTYFK